MKTHEKIIANIKDVWQGKKPSTIELQNEKIINKGTKHFDYILGGK